MKKEPWAEGLLALLLLPFMLLVSLFEGVVSLVNAIRFSPTRKEEDARELNDMLYRQALERYTFDSGQYLDRIEDHVMQFPTEYAKCCINVAGRFWTYENFGIPKPPAVADSIEGARYRDTLSNLADLSQSVESLCESFSFFAHYIPHPTEGIALDIPARDLVTGEILERIVAPLYRDGALFERTRRQLDKNLDVMSGITASDSSKAVVLPGKYKGKESIFKYVEDTPLQRLFDFAVPYVIPTKARYEHLHLCAATGGGKTQLIQTLVAQDIETDASIIVMAPKGTMIPTIARLRAIDPDRLILITPESLPALNIFNLGSNDTNTTVGLINYIFSAILHNEPTGKQTGLLNNCIRLMLRVPNATIKTFRNLLKQPTAEEYAEYFPLLSESGREFFTEQFGKKAIYGETKEQILQRLDLMLENPTIEKIFSQPETRFDMGREIEAGKIILIDTSLRHLGEFGSSFLGRFFISLVTLASQQRDTASTLKPVWFYIDEASTYLSADIETLLERARESKVGLALAHQQLAQLSRISPQLEASVLTNTSIKIVGGCSHGDANTFSKEIGVASQTLQDQKPLHFHIRVKGHGAIPILVKAGYMESLPTRSQDEMDLIIEENKAKYAAVTRPAESVPEPAPPADDDFESLNKA